MPPQANSPDGPVVDPAGETSIPETDGGPPRVGKGRAAGRAASQNGRRCVATMESYPQSQMIRFVLSPDGVVTPDLAARLPGRGAWVLATRDALALAAKRGAFSRAFKTQAKTGPDLAGQVEQLLVSRAMDQLGLAKRAGDLILGFEQVREAIQTARPGCLIEASDGAEDGRSNILALLRAVHGPERGAGRDAPGSDSGLDDQLDKQAANQRLPPVAGCFSADELGMALGRGRVIHACLKQGRFATNWTGELARLSGFRRVWLEGRPSAGWTSADSPAASGQDTGGPSPGDPSSGDLAADDN
jgi:uncharacterized protein